jgi:hypothetical protein
MTRSKRVRRGVGRLSKSRTVGIAGLVLLLGSGLSWADSWNPTGSDGNGNTAGGDGTLTSPITPPVQGPLITGSYNSGFGYFALTNSNLVNISGSNNSAFGASALGSNTTGSDNSAFGVTALAGNTDGSDNTASGWQSLFSNTTGFDNTAFGIQALVSNKTGNFNTATGGTALLFNTSGNANTAVGSNAGLSNTTGSNNTFIGNNANANAGIYTNGTALGHGAVLTASNSITLGNSCISAIFAHVGITVTSDRRRKKDIQALGADLGLDFIEKLQPVSYRFNNGDETERYGFIAQDLEQALPASLHDTVEKSEPEHGLALIERQNDEDRSYRVSYGELTAPIVKAIQQQQQEITEMRQQNAELRHALEDQAAAFKAENDALRHSIAALKEQVTAAR